MTPVLCSITPRVQLDLFLNRFKQSEDKLCRRDDLLIVHISVEQWPGQPREVGCGEKTRNVIYFYWPQIAKSFIPSITQQKTPLKAYLLSPFHIPFSPYLAHSFSRPIFLKIFSPAASSFPFHPPSSVLCCCAPSFKGCQYYFLSIHPQHTNATVR